MTTRRDFLMAVGASALGPDTLHAALHIAERTPARPARRDAMNATPRAGIIKGVGIQMFMMRDEMKADLDASLARVARLGYEEVEWWGAWGRSPAQLRTLLDGLGLRAPTQHVGSDALAPAKLDATLDAAGTLGHHTVIVAGMGAGYTDDADGWKRAAELLNAAGAKAAPLGIRVGYHNHAREFNKHGGVSALEIMMNASDPATVDFQLDCFWAYKGGQDPLAFLRAHKDRIAQLHLKDAAAVAPHAQVDLGKGILDWRALIALGVSQRVTNITLDMDDPADAWASAGSCRAYLRGLGY